MRLHKHQGSYDELPPHWILYESTTRWLRAIGQRVQSGRVSKTIFQHFMSANALEDCLLLAKSFPGVKTSTLAPTPPDDYQHFMATRSDASVGTISTRSKSLLWIAMEWSPQSLAKGLEVAKQIGRTVPQARIAIFLSGFESHGEIDDRLRFLCLELGVSLVLRDPWEIDLFLDRLDSNSPPDRSMHFPLH